MIASVEYLQGKIQYTSTSPTVVFIGQFSKITL